MRARGPSAAAPRSLRRTLLAWLIAPLLVLVPLTATIVHALAVRPALDGLDRALTDTAVALTGILVDRDGQPSLPLTEQTARALRADLVDEVRFAVGDGSGRLLGGDAAVLSLSPTPRAGQWLFFDATLRGRPVRVAAYGAACSAGTCPILVTESLGKRVAAERAVAVAASAAALLLATTLALLALVAVQRALTPLERASTQIASRSLAHLEPIDLAPIPREAASFVVAINELFARLRDAASAQRAFVAAASHQLRTPLATLLSESSQALAQPHPAALRPTLERLHAAAERGARLAQQLLTLARAEGVSADARVVVDLADLVTDCANDWLRPSLAAGQDLGFELERAPVLGNALLLRELAANLIHNAIQHAGAGARVTVRTRRAGEAAVLEVEDDGPGLPADEVGRVWDRFYRGRSASGLGAGLGLAIVRDIAAAHGGRAVMRQGEAGRGIAVSVTLPLAPAAANRASAA